MKADDAVALKQCCARLYESDLARMFLGDSFHPGGIRLTARIGELLNLAQGSRVLDVACGNGAAAFFLAEHFGCHVVGIDYSSQHVAGARQLAAAKGLSPLIQFESGDAESLPFSDGTFDAVICECAFCTFPNKAGAAREFERVLGPRGRVGLSDITRGPALPEELNSLLAWLACIADAQPVEAYAEYLRCADLKIENIELHDEALTEMVQQIGVKLLGARVLAGLNKIALPGIDLTAAEQMARSALAAIQKGQLGYAVLIAAKPGT
jgi:arsenite methyltransferase